MARHIKFATLWDHAKLTAKERGADRMLSVILNHEKKKEYICRKLGIINFSDVNRVFKNYPDKNNT